MKRTQICRRKTRYRGLLSNSIKKILQQTRKKDPTQSPPRTQFDKWAEKRGGGVRGERNDTYNIPGVVHDVFRQLMPFFCQNGFCELTRGKKEVEPRWQSRHGWWRETEKEKGWNQEKKARGQKGAEDENLENMESKDKYKATSQNLTVSIAIWLRFTNKQVLINAQRALYALPRPFPLRLRIMGHDVIQGNFFFLHCHVTITLFWYWINPL